MLEEALVYPKRGGWRTILIGGLLSLFGFLIIPMFILYGYMVRVLRSAALNEVRTPQFENWGKLLIDGLKGFVIGIAYVIVPYTIMTVAVLGALFTLIKGEGSGIIVAIFFVLLGLSGFVSLFAVSYVLPVALTNFALKDRIGAAFEFGTIINAAFTRDYVVAVLLSMGIGAVVGTVMSVAGFIIQFCVITVLAILNMGGGEPTVALFIVAGLLIVCVAVVFVFVMFYVQIATYYILGQGCGATLVDDSPVNHRID